jgi:hypothetical protein
MRRVRRPHSLPSRGEKSLCRDHRRAEKGFRWVRAVRVPVCRARNRRLARRIDAVWNALRDCECGGGSRLSGDSHDFLQLAVGFAKVLKVKTYVGRGNGIRSGTVHQCRCILFFVEKVSHRATKYSSSAQEFAAVDRHMTVASVPKEFVSLQGFTPNITAKREMLIVLRLYLLENWRR